MMVFNFSVKNNIRRIIMGSLICLLPGVNTVFAENISAFPKDKVVCVTIPKTGTHLLLKCISLLGIPGLSYNYKKYEAPIRFLKNLQYFPKFDFAKDARGIRTHHIHSKEFEVFIAERTSANFFMLRDPRAQIVSLAKESRLQESPMYRIDGEKRDVEEFLLDFILARKKNFSPTRDHKNFKNISPSMVVRYVDLLWDIGLYEFYKLYIPWIKAKKFYTVRFENLIGEKGGGSRELQLQEIQNIVRHLGLSLSEQKITEVAENLFGGTSTFRVGQIDSWKQYFTPRVKEAFKADKRLVQLLIDLGYEKDTNW